MLISNNDLAKYANTLVKFLDTNKILDIDSLLKFSGKKYEIEDEDSSHIELTYGMIPKRITPVISLAYIVEGSKTKTGGVPIDARIDPILMASNIILKSNSLIPGYIKWGSDRFGNFYQNRSVFPTTYQEYKAELEKLSRI